VWLVTYLHYVSHRLRAGRDSTPAGNDAQSSTPLGRALALGPALWTSRRRAEGPASERREAPRLETLVQPWPGVGAKAMAPHRLRSKSMRAIQPKLAPSLHTTFMALAFVKKIQKRRKSILSPIDKDAVAKLKEERARTASTGGSESSDDSDAPDPPPSEERHPLQDSQRIRQGSPMRRASFTLHKIARERSVKQHASPQELTRPNELWSLNELFKTESGKPCIVDGVCTLCHNPVDPEHWGHATCRGCSMVDAAPFEEHLFSALLCGRPSNVQVIPPVAHLPLTVARASLTPPPTRNLSTLLLPTRHVLS